MCHEDSISKTTWNELAEVKYNMKKIKLYIQNI